MNDENWDKVERIKPDDPRYKELGGDGVDALGGKPISRASAKHLEKLFEYRRKKGIKPLPELPTDN